MNIILEKAVRWFVSIKAPELKEKVEAALVKINEEILPEGNYKKVFGFILFDFSMHQGPPIFSLCEKAAIEIGVLEEMKEYAQDWIRYSKKIKSSL